MRLLVFSLLLLSAAGCASGLPPRIAGPAGGPARPPFFISPMGEPFRSPQRDADLAGQWFGAADADRDGRLVLAEMEADAIRFFRTLDLDGDGEIEPDEMRRYETEIVPELSVAPPGRAGMGPGGPGAMRRRGGPDGGGGSRRRGPPRGGGGGDRHGPLNLPQPVAAADADFNRGVSVDEFRRAAGQRLVRLDRNRDGALTLEELQPPPPGERRR